MSEDDVQITRNKRLLEDIRNGNEGHIDSPGERNGHVESRDNEHRQNEGAAIRSSQGIARGTERAGENNGAIERLYEGIRPTDRTNVNTTQSSGSSNRRRKEDIKAVPPPVEQAKVPPEFKLKNPFAKLGKDKEPVRLFSKTEVELELERMTEIYQRGSALIDDVLEIIVKDHEPVSIWELDNEDAAMLATLHLERATKDVAAARSARKLLEIYDRIFFWLVVGPRVKATTDHIVTHKGFSFK